MRPVILVPDEQDRTNPKYASEYWPNFVWRVRHAIYQAGLSCDVLVVGSTVELAPPDADKG